MSNGLSEELARDGKDAFLRAHVTRMTPGLASGAFHGIIRTAYAVDSGVDDDLPDAITSWIRSYEELGTRDDNRRFENPRDAFLALQRDDRFRERLPGTSITSRIRKVAANPA